MCLPGVSVVVVGCLCGVAPGRDDSHSPCHGRCLPIGPGGDLDHCVVDWVFREWGRGIRVRASSRVGGGARCALRGAGRGRHRLSHCRARKRKKHSRRRHPRSSEATSCARSAIAAPPPVSRALLRGGAGEGRRRGRRSFGRDALGGKRGYCSRSSLCARVRMREYDECVIERLVSSDCPSGAGVHKEQRRRRGGGIRAAAGGARAGGRRQNARSAPPAAAPCTGMITSKTAH